jgi:hypothetical protein
MKRILVLIIGLFMLWFAFTVYAANPGTYGERTFRLENLTSYNQYTKYVKQSGEIQVKKLWWIGCTDARDTLCDTIYTDWVDLGSPSGSEDLYSMKVLPKLKTVDTVAAWDSADTYIFELQTCLNPRTSDSLYISNCHTFATLTDTGTKVWYCPADSGLLYIAYWTQYVRTRIIMRGIVDTVVAFAKGGYDQAAYIPIKYEVVYKPIWK